MNGSFWSEVTLDHIVSSAGLYRIVVWIVLYRRLDSIVSDGFGSYRIVWIRKHWILCAGWLLAGWYGWTGWGVGGTGVGRTVVSTCRNGSATMGAGTGAPLMALEGRRAMIIGGWHQLHHCCKEADYLCQRGKIIQIECTRIGTNT